MREFLSCDNFSKITQIPQMVKEENISSAFFLIWTCEKWRWIGDCKKLKNLRKPIIFRFFLVFSLCGLFTSLHFRKNTLDGDILKLWFYSCEGGIYRDFQKNNFPAQFPHLPGRWGNYTADKRFFQNKSDSFHER